MVSREFENVIYDYEQMLIGRYKRVDPWHFKIDNKETRSRKALAVIQYFIETYFEWTPQMARDHLSPSVLKAWGLGSLLEYIDIPEDIKSLDEICFYIVHMIYPETIKINKQDIYIAVYKKVLNSKTLNFPKGFFASGSGRSKVCACLKYAIENNLFIDSIDEMYEFFGSRECLKFLRETAKLSSKVKMLFNCPIEAFHQTLPPSQQDCFKYEVLRFHQLLDAKIKKIGGRKLGRPLVHDSTKSCKKYNDIIDKAIKASAKEDE